jgi:hypothetical protein
VPDSYAARTGDARDVGVVGAAVFPERMPRPFPRPMMKGEPSARADDLRRQGAPESSGAPAPSAEARGDAGKRLGLGTAFGEEHGSHVEQVAFEREGERPAAVLEVRYDDERGLAAQGIDLDGGLARRDEAWRRRSADPFPAGFAEPPPGWRR